MLPCCGSANPGYDCRRCPGYQKNYPWTQNTITIKVDVKAVQLMDGWVGQIVVDGKIVWESQPLDGELLALRDAKDRATDKVQHLFT